MHTLHHQLPLNPRSLHNPLYIAFCYMMHVNSTPEPTQHRALVLTREAAEHATVKTPTTASSASASSSSASSSSLSSAPASLPANAERGSNPSFQHSETYADEDGDDDEEYDDDDSEHAQLVDEESAAQYNAILITANVSSSSSGASGPSAGGSISGTSNISTKYSDSQAVAAAVAAAAQSMGAHMTRLPTVAELRYIHARGAISPTRANYYCIYSSSHAKMEFESSSRGILRWFSRNMWTCLLNPHYVPLCC